MSPEIRPQHIPQAALYAVAETRKFLTESQESPQDITVELTDEEQTAEGFLQLATQRLEVQIALHLDAQYATAQGLGDTALQANRKECNELDQKLRILSQNEQLRVEANELIRERSVIAKKAIAFYKNEKRLEEISRSITTLYQVAAASGRNLTAADRRKIAEYKDEQTEVRNTQVDVDSEDMIEPLTIEIQRRMRKEWRKQLDKGLLKTEGMMAIVSEALPSLMRGNPVLFVGETGGAKTALAEHIARSYIGKEPEFVSIHPEINAYQLMGKATLKNGQSGFEPGPIVRAMQEGRPLILDEVNAVKDSHILKRLNKIMQLRPGDHYTIQEDSGLQVAVKSGFCIMATANEKSKRYKGVDDLSVEFQNRFAANTYRIRYPDHDVVTGQIPRENLMLAVAALVDKNGEFTIEIPKLESFVKAAHISQKLFSGEKGDKELEFADANRIADDKPGLDESVIAPRTMVAILEKVRNSYGSIPLSQVLNRWIDGIKNPLDRATMTKLLTAHYLLEEAQED